MQSLCGQQFEGVLVYRMASIEGSARSQSFLADDDTARLVKGAATHVRTISVSADGLALTYHLERDRQPRATVVFKRASTSQAPGC